MEVIDVSFDLKVPATAVWPFVEDFLNVEAWWPKTGSVEIERVAYEGEGIGCIRHIYNMGFTHAISEQLDFLDSNNFLWELSIVCDRPAGLTGYQATGQLKPVDKASSILTYHAEFDAEEGRVEEARSFLLGCYDFMKLGLENAAAKAMTKG